MNWIDVTFGIAAVVGFGIWVLSMIVGFLHDMHRLFNLVIGNRGPRVSVKATVDELYDSTPYAATRNAKQAITRGQS